MRILRLRLTQFRNYRHAELAPAPGVTVLYGENAQGKTNLVEAVYFCCLGRSHRTSRDADLFQMGQAECQADMRVLRRDGEREVSVRLSRDDARKKNVKIDGMPVAKMGEMMGLCNAVLFSPEDLRLVKDGPDARRRFMDMEISQAQPQYFYALQRYTRALVQRNNLLKAIAKGPSQALLGTLDAWDQLLIDAGGQLIARRRAYIDKLKMAAAPMHAGITSDKEALDIQYECRADSADAFACLLRAARHEDFRRMTTTVGPHRDDLKLTVNGKDARVFASQGQQRTVALALKLAEIEVLRDLTGESPVLLLDDVMSELDIPRRQALLSVLAKTQTIITCTALSDLGGAAAEKVVKVEKGELRDEG